MKIIVCIKQIGFIYHPTGIDLSTGEIDLEKMVQMLNPYDEVAVEEAIRIKEKAGNCEVTIITAGEQYAEGTLRYAYAMGCDKMIRVACDNKDPWVISSLLAKAIEETGYDMVLCGQKAMDSNESQVGSLIAEMLGLPQVSGIVKLELSDDKRNVNVERYLGKGNREEIECALPALFTVEMLLNEPRYPTLYNRHIAKDAEIVELEYSSGEVKVEENLMELEGFSQPRPKPRKVFAPSSKSLSAEDMVRQMMSASTGGKGGGSDILEGSGDQMAENIIELLMQEKMI